MLVYNYKRTDARNSVYVSTTPARLPLHKQMPNQTDDRGYIHSYRTNTQVKIHSHVKRPNSDYSPPYHCISPLACQGRNFAHSCFFFSLKYSFGPNGRVLVFPTICNMHACIEHKQPIQKILLSSPFKHTSTNAVDRY